MAGTVIDTLLRQGMSQSDVARVLSGERVAPAPKKREEDISDLALTERKRLKKFKFAADDGAFDEALNVAQERNVLDEARGIERVLGNAQGRGLARSGIALKDIVEQVLGPSILRSRELASSFGLQKLANLQDQDRLKFGGIANIGQSMLGNANAERMMLLEQQREDSLSADARKRQRQGGLAGLIGGTLGGVVGGPLGAKIGSGLGNLF